MKNHNYQKLNDYLLRPHNPKFIKSPRVAEDLPNMEKLTSEQNAVAGFIDDLIDEYDRVESFFMTKPNDYTDGKDAWQELLRDIAGEYWLPKE